MAKIARGSAFTPRHSKAVRAHSTSNMPARYLLAAGALVSMVAVSVFASPENSGLLPPLSIPQFSTNASPQLGETEVAAPAGPQNTAPAQPDFLGSDPSSAAIAVSQRVHAGGASRVYLAREDNPVDALPAAALNDGPVLFVPRSGAISPAVSAEIKRLGAASAVVLGGPGAIGEDVLASIGATTGVSAQRWSGSTRVDTAATIATNAFPNASVVYLANALGSDGRGSPDAVAAGVLKGGPIMVVTNAPGDIARAASVVKQLGASKVVALGGNSVVSDAVLSQVAGGKAVGRLAGSDRYETSFNIGKSVYGGGAPRVYLASGSNLAFALAAGAVNDGPILLMPAQANGKLRSFVTGFGNPYVSVVGGAASVPGEVSQVAAGFKQVSTGAAPVGAAAAPVAGDVMQANVYSLPASPADSAKEAAVFNAINAERAKNGLQPLKRNPAMDDAARAWAQQVARSGVFEHSTTSKKSAKSLSYSDLIPKGWKIAGENMVGYYSVEPGAYGAGATQLWMNSPGHKANIMRGVFNTTGIGVATGRDWVYCIQNFAQY